MSERASDSGTPEYIEAETTAGRAARAERIDQLVDRISHLDSRISGLSSEIAEYKIHTPTKEDVRAEVTGARASIALQISGMATKESLETNLKQIAKDIEAIQPPKFWHLVALALGAVVTIGGIIWQASGRVGDLATQNALMQRDVDGLREALKRLEQSESATTSKLDQLLIHQANKP